MGNDYDTPVKNGPNGYNNANGDSGFNSENDNLKETMIIFAIGTLVAIKTIVAIGNSVLPAYHHRFLYIVIVAIGIIFTIVAIGVMVAIGTIV